jgi:UPF0755 protein
MPERGPFVSNDNQYERVPDAVVPKHRGGALARVLGSLVGWSMFFAIAVGGLAFWAWGVFTSQGPLQSAKVISLADGMSRTEIAEMLEDQGVISDSRVMSAASLINSFRGGTLKPGEYEFQAGAPMAAVLNAMSAGKVLTYKLTIPEGWTSQMALARINENNVLSGPPISAVPEAALVADTQVFRRGMTRAKLLQDMQDAQVKLVDEIWAKRPADSPLKTKEELVTLASIVEKETGKSDERARVAAVFLNRLRQGMKLQSDPTIIYGIVGGAGKLERGLTRSDIASQTPYNTYQIPALPPGPIAIPGRASLEAVMAPAQTQDLFFVADGTGGHAFAATLDEHNANVKKWRDGQKNGIQLPGDEPAVESAPLTEVQQTPLPAVEVPPAPAPVVEDGQAVDDATKTAAAVQTVPTPVEEGGAAQPAVAVPKAAEPPPLPVQKKPKPAVVAAAAAVVLKPGTVVKVGEKLVPIPRLKRARP